MFQRILVPLDGSPLAERAVPVAVHLVRATQGTLILLRVYQPIISDSTVPLALAEQEGADERETATYLAQLAAREDLAGIAVETAVLCGAPVANILDAVQQYHADSIVMTSHGRSGLTRLILGSVAEQVVHHAHVPVLILHRTDLLLQSSVDAGYP